jgi:hypothetical protein
MKRDIVQLQVSDVYIAIVPGPGEGGQTQWSVVLINDKDVTLTHVIVNASGKGMVDGKEKSTATLRLFLGEIAAKSSKAVEVLLEESFTMNNNYWVSFYIGSDIYDKKYQMSAGEVDLNNLVFAPVINAPAILIK